MHHTEMTAEGETASAKAKASLARIHAIRNWQ